MRAPRPIVLIAGPTASGKSALGLAIAEEFRGTLINADSMQVYRDLAILTARPSAAELARAPHRLYGVLDAGEVCSAARWCAMAEAEIAAAQAEGRLPLLVGGTGLYFRALLKGLAPVPEIPAAVRAAARALHKSIGGVLFHAELARRDPEASTRLHPSDSQRLIRAYEVVTATGRTLRDWQRGDGAGTQRRAAALLLLPPREVLYDAIDRRFLAMIERGAPEEVRALLARGLAPELPAMKAVGVPELIRVIRGEISLEAAMALAQQASRNYAKRQITWFRHQLPSTPDFPVLRLAAQYSESLLPEIFSFIRQFVLTSPVSSG
ncbi:MAG TPA: tRNA (adenosine(37)-N6)-dimethylallyltransferase MiaA [Stellaceae bacterium]|nr:tRNA (adenosine(37)-N6)-dimethylallyltransferase MiaA [Stellaceae bacterium]